MKTFTFPLSRLCGSWNLQSRYSTYTLKVKNFDPPYLSAKPPLPILDDLQFAVTGRDFVVLEKFGSYLHRFFINFNLEVENFPLPAKNTTYRIYHANSTKVQSEFELSEFRRIFMVSGLKAVYFPILLDLVYQNLPEGVEITINKRDPNLDEERYVPQLELEALQEELSKIATS